MEMSLVFFSLCMFFEMNQRSFSHWNFTLNNEMVSLGNIAKEQAKRSSRIKLGWQKSVSGVDGGGLSWGKGGLQFPLSACPFHLKLNPT